MIYPLSFPSQAPATVRLALNRRQSVAQSTWSLKEQVIDTSTQWMLQWSWPPMTHAKAERIAGWLQSLKGQQGSFRFAPYQSVKYPLTGLSLAIRGYAYNDTVRLKGFAANSPTGFRIGQYFQIGDQLLQIVEAGALADGDGAVTVSFEPPLRADYAVDTVVNFATPTGLFKLASADGSAFTLDPNRTPDFGTIQAREVV